MDRLNRALMLEDTYGTPSIHISGVRQAQKFSTDASCLPNLKPHLALFSVLHDHTRVLVYRQWRTGEMIWCRGGKANFDICRVLYSSAIRLFGCFS